MKPKLQWTHEEIDQSLRCHVNKTSDSFDTRAERLLNSSRTTSEQWFKQSPTMILIPVAACIILTIGIVSYKNNFTEYDLPSQIETYSDIIVMDDTLEAGIGVLDYNNLEAIQSLSMEVTRTL